MSLNNNSKGFLLVEVILSTALFVMFITAFSGVLFYGQQSSATGGNRARASMFAEEGQEAVRSIKNINFASLTDGTHGLLYSNSAWSFSGVSDVDPTGAFTRQVVVTPIDANRKTITTTVTWQATPQRTGSVTLTERVTNWRTVLNLGQGLMVNKIVINHGLASTTADFAPYKVGTTTVALATSTKFGAGTYTVSETVSPNFTQTFTGDCNASGQVTLTSSSSKLCTITNEEKLTYITASSTVINHGGTKTVADFAPFKIGSTTIAIGAKTLINSGTYLLSEGTVPNYVLSFSGQCFTNGTVVLNSGDDSTCYLTNEEQLGQGYTGTSLAGILIYGDGTTIPKYRIYNHIDNVFGAETSTFNATVGPTWLIRTSPTAHIALAGYYDVNANLTIMCFDGTNWTREYVAASGGVGNRHRFDIAFEKNSGDALVFFSKGSTSNDATRWGRLGYRTKSGATGCGTANWSNESIFTPQRTTSDIMYVKMAQDKRASSNIIAAQWVDTNNDISAAIWNGSAWVNEPSAVSDNNVEVVTTGHDIENMDIEYESQSGNLMMVWANAAGNNNTNTNGVRYRRCTGGTSTCTWGSVTTPPTFVDDATTLDLAANPGSNEMVFASIGNSGGDLQIGYWSGSAWTNTANVDTSCNIPFVASKLVSVGWLTYASTTRSVVVYSDLNSTSTNWYLGNAGVFTRQVDFANTPSIATPRGYMDIHINPRSLDQIMFVTSDNNSDLYAKRLIMTGTSTFVWSNSDGGVLETNLPQIISSPFSFAFWQQ